MSVKSFGEIKKIYEDHPADIDTVAVEQGNIIQRKWHRIKLNAVISEIEKMSLPKGSKVLDLACGSGGLTFKLAERFPEFVFVGCDFNKYAIEYANKKIERLLIDNMDFVCCSAEELDLISNSFDVVLGLDALDHFYKPKKALKEMNRVLKKDGLLVLIVRNYNSIKWIYLEKLLDLVWKQSRNYTETHLTHFTFRTLWYMVSESDFSELKMYKLHLGMSLFCVARKRWLE